MATLYEITAIGKYQGQQVVNRLTHVTDIDDPTVVSAFTYAQALGIDPGDTSAPSPDTVLDSLLLCQGSSYQMESLFFRNLFSVIDFYTFVPSGAGWAGQQSWTGAVLPSFVSQKFKTNRVRTDIRAGTLSLTPPNEASVNDVGTITGTHLDLMATLVQYLNEPPSYTAGPVTVNFRPSILQKEKYAVPDTDPVRYAYRYYEDKDDQLEHTAIGVTWSLVPTVTTQTSRKVGKGA